MLEVEIKAEVKIRGIEKKIRDLGARFIKKELQEDTYFRHPCRDFKAKDEALRVRMVEGEYFLTYKGERQDPETKTRLEIETKVARTILGILKVLGFSEMRKIVKEREVYSLSLIHI